MSDPVSAPPPLPPKDCKACKGVADLLAAFSSSRGFSSTPGSEAKSASHAPAAAAEAAPQGPHEAGSLNSSSSTQPACPPDTQQLGRAAWTFLHTTAAYYPEQPSDCQKSLMRSMMDGLAEFYPCHYCAAHLREQLKASPPEVGSARELSSWLCRIHNEVNAMLGKPVFDCSKAQERWKDGPPDGSCD